jgi:N-methylhydantoinase A/oxoprolinase/acetone carboxylase beta subunit
MAAPDSAPAVVIGIDTGGTFTDVTLLDPRTGGVANAKVP